VGCLRVIRRNASAAISIPLLEISERLAMPAVLTHSSIVLSNFRLLDPLGPWDVSNLATLTVCIRAAVHRVWFWAVVLSPCISLAQQFFGGTDESYFYMITAELEAIGGPCLSHVWAAQDAAFFVLREDLPPVRETILHWLTLVSVSGFAACSV
jgi:hypothetical protein